MNKIISFLLMFIFIIFISGCGIPKIIRANETKEKLMQLNVGMTKDEVLSILGNPDKREVYGEREFLIYETTHKINLAEEKRFTPILIEYGKVVGWGRNYYDNATKSKIEADINIKNK